MALPTAHKYTPVSHNALDEAVTLDEGFITPISSVDTPPSSAHTYLEVVAPATLPEGYAFEAEVKGETFTVRVVSAMFGSVCVFVLLVAHIKHTFVSTVVCIAHYQPLGGVEEGQKFSVPFSAGSRGYSGAAVPRVSVPVGHWKVRTRSANTATCIVSCPLTQLFQLPFQDGLCCTGCCAYGICHPVLWNSYCCPLGTYLQFFNLNDVILLIILTISSSTALAGQVMSRLKLTWTANEGTSAQALATFRILLGISIAFVVADNILFLYPLYFHEMPKDPYNKYENEQYVEYVMRFGFCRMVLRVIFNLFAVYVVWKTRAYIREKYSIPARCCGECEDCCCSFWCTCCTIGQMARHTADYETYAAICCNDTGLPSHVPNIV